MAVEPAFFFGVPGGRQGLRTRFHIWSTESRACSGVKAIPPPFPRVCSRSSLDPFIVVAYSGPLLWWVVAAVCCPSELCRGAAKTETSEAKLVSVVSLRALSSSVRLYPAGVVLHCSPGLGRKRRQFFGDANVFVCGRLGRGRCRVGNCRTDGRRARRPNCSDMALSLGSGPLSGPWERPGPSSPKTCVVLTSRT